MVLKRLTYLYFHELSLNDKQNYLQQAHMGISNTLADKHKFRILVVDDEALIVLAITNILEKEGYEILAAFQGEAAYKIAKESIPDLIILDWDMPILNGIETLKKLKSDTDTMHIPAIMITGSMTSLDHLKTAFDAGVIDFINKPVEAIELVSRVRSMLMLSHYYKETLKQKDWELTLLSKDFQQSVELFHKIIVPLENLLLKLRSNNIEDYEMLRLIISEIKGTSMRKTWDEFHAQFKKVHPDFGTNLLKAFPNLTSEEIKLCHLLRLNMNTKEIADITFRNAHSVDIARYRLRKKIGLERNENLIGFLSNF